MREVFLNYWNWFADLANPYHDVIIAISTVIIAAFTVVLRSLLGDKREMQGPPSVAK